MISVDEVTKHLDGNGLTSHEISKIAVNLAIFADIKNALENSLLGIFNDAELKKLLGIISSGKSDRTAVSDSLKGLSTRQKEIYILHIVENKNVPMIAAELGLSQTRVENSLIRAKSKVKDIEIKSLIDPSPEVWEKLIHNTETLTPTERERCLLHFVEGKSVNGMSKESGIHKTSLQIALHNAKRKFDTSILY